MSPTFTPAPNGAPAQPQRASGGFPWQDIVKGTAAVVVPLAARWLMDLLSEVLSRHTQQPPPGP